MHIQVANGEIRHITQLPAFILYINLFLLKWKLKPHHMEQPFSGYCMIISTFPGHSGSGNTQLYPLDFGSYNLRFLRVAYFLSCV